jgi:hypothetical protein
MSKAKKVISLLDRLFDKEVAEKVTKSKEEMVTSGRVAEALEEQMQLNPRFLDDLEIDDYEELVDELPPKQRASLLGEDSSMYETAEMMGDMTPSSAAKQFEVFGDMDEFQVYASTLKGDDVIEFIDNLPEDDFQLLGGLMGSFDLDEVAEKISPSVAGKKVELFLDDEEKLMRFIEKQDAGGLRQFLDNVPDDIYEEFDGFSEYMPATGPRVVKAEGGLLENPEEMSSDKDMEEDYIEHVMKALLSDEDYEYVDKALEKDDKLSVLFDEIVLSAVEFTGAGEVEGPGDGTSDSIPARLSDGEFVFTKKAVEELGADKLQTMMKEAEAAADKREQKAKGGVMDNTQADTRGVDDEVSKYMLQANRMPSVQGR